MKLNKNFVCPFCHFGCESSKLKYVFEKKTNICEKLKTNIDNLTDNIQPMIKGKNVNLNEAIKEIKKLVYLNNGIHIDGLSCDLESMNRLFDFAELKNASIDHMYGENIANFFSCFQRNGASLSSYGEVKNRADLIIFVGLREELKNSKLVSLIRNSKEKKKIYFIDSTFKDKKKKLNCHEESSIYKKINMLSNFFEENNKQNSYENFKKKNTLIISDIVKSKYGVIVFEAGTINKVLNQSILNLVNILSRNYKFSILPLGGGSNSAGAIQTSLWKTGFPLRVNFTDDGPIYNPEEYNSNSFKHSKELQFYISCFDLKPKINFFKKNIFIGNPNILNREKFDVYIPVSTPGIDSDGLIVRGDGACVIKLNKLKDSKYPSIKDIFLSLGN